MSCTLDAIQRAFPRGKIRVYAAKEEAPSESVRTRRYAKVVAFVAGACFINRLAGKRPVSAGAKAQVLCGSHRHGWSRAL